MADVKKRLTSNVAGDFFVDSTCIDCDTCRQLAPQVFHEAGDYSAVYHQPQDEAQVRAATRALLACPTGSIGTLGVNRAREVMADFPLRLDENVYYVGFNSPKSYGGNSYFIRHPGGNWLIDSPKFLPYLVERFEAMGGVRYIFLTHQDDVAEAHRYASERIIHMNEKSAQPDAERFIEGEEALAVAPGFVIIPTPGHTSGHCVLLYDNRFLFTGDHMGWDRERKRLYASKSYSWYSWPKQKASVEKLLGYTFEWVLPGHGDRVNLPAPEMRMQLEALVDRIRPT
jgi:glyoxylase-like metal-dependent hydrolase (beta-lactamase superfamily II)/ferredoxin